MLIDDLTILIPTDGQDIGDVARTLYYLSDLVIPENVVLLYNGGFDPETRPIPTGLCRLQAFSRPMGDYATWRNSMIQHARTDWVYFCDGDETPPPAMFAKTPWRWILQPVAEFPRWNVEVSPGHREPPGPDNWPDYQGRLLRTSSGVKWHGKVHERLICGKGPWRAPCELAWAIRHSHDRQWPRLEQLRRARHQSYLDIAEGRA